MSMSPNCSPPAFDRGTPPITCGECPLSTVPGVNSPESSAAAAVTTFIVEPGSYVLCVGRLTSGALLSLLSCLRVVASLTRLGSKPGTEAIASTAPVEGSIATTEPPAPLDPGVEAIADWRAWVATPCVCASIVSVTSSPSCGTSRSWSMIEVNSLRSPARKPFSNRSIPVRPAWMKL